MSNPRLHGQGNGGAPQRAAHQISADSLCPLPLIGWKPSVIAGPDGRPDQPTPVLCMGPACRWFVQTGPATPEEPLGKHQCAPAAIAVVVSQLPGAFAWFAERAAAEATGKPWPPTPEPQSAEPSAAEPEAPQLVQPDEPSQF